MEESRGTTRELEQLLAYAPFGDEPISAGELARWLLAPNSQDAPEPDARSGPPTSGAS